MYSNLLAKEPWVEMLPGGDVMLIDAWRTATFLESETHRPPRDTFHHPPLFFLILRKYLHHQYPSKDRLHGNLWIIFSHMTCPSIPIGLIVGFESPSIILILKSCNDFDSDVSDVCAMRNVRTGRSLLNAILKSVSF